MAGGSSARAPPAPERLSHFDTCPREAPLFLQSADQDSLMNRSVLLRAVAAVAFAGSTACVSITTPKFMKPAPERDWKSTLSTAQQLATAGQVREADSVLASYAQAYPTSPNAVETNYWRSLFLLHAGDEPSASGAAVPMLQNYVAAGGTEHRLEADALLRAAWHVDSLSRATAVVTRTSTSNGDVVPAQRTPGEVRTEVKVVPGDTKEQDAEIRRLKDELA